MTVVIALGVQTGSDGAGGTFDETAYADFPNPDQSLTAGGFVQTGVSTTNGFPIWVRNGPAAPTQEQIDGLTRLLDRIVRGAHITFWGLAELRAWYQAHPNAVVFAAHV